MPPPTIAALPLELLCRILCFLPFADAVRAGAADRGFREAARAALARGSEVLPGRQLLNWMALWGAFRSIMEQPLERRGLMARAFTRREEALPAADQRFHFRWGRGFGTFDANFEATVVLGVDGAPPVTISVESDSVSFRTRVPGRDDYILLSFGFWLADKSQAQLIYFSERHHDDFSFLHVPLSCPPALPFFSLVHTLLALVGVTVLSPYAHHVTGEYMPSVRADLPLARFRHLAAVFGWDTSFENDPYLWPDSDNDSDFYD